MGPAQDKGLYKWCTGKESVCQCERNKRCRFNAWVRKIPWRKKWQPTPVFLPGESHEKRSLVGYSPCGSQKVGHDWAQHSSTIQEVFVSYFWTDLPYWSTVPNWSSPWILRKALVPIILFALIIIINGFSSLPFSSLVSVLEGWFLWTVSSRLCYSPALANKRHHQETVGQKEKEVKVFLPCSLPLCIGSVSLATAAVSDRQPFLCICSSYWTLEILFPSLIPLDLKVVTTAFWPW